MVGDMFSLSAKNLALAVIFGVTIFIFETLLPTPIDKVFTFFQAMLLSLGYLLLGVPGATLISLIGGSLTAIWRAPLAPFTISFALLYGVLIDAFCSVLRVSDGKEDVRQMNLIVAVTISTLITGLASYCIAVMFDLMPMNPTLGMVILVSGILSGIIGGYLSTVLWKKIPP